MKIDDMFKRIVAAMDIYLANPSEKTYRHMVHLAPSRSYCCIYGDSPAAFWPGISCEECNIQIQGGFCRERWTPFMYDERAAARYLAFVEFREVLRVKTGV